MHAAGGRWWRGGAASLVCRLLLLLLLLGFLAVGLGRLLAPALPVISGRLAL